MTHLCQPKKLPRSNVSAELIIVLGSLAAPFVLRSATPLHAAGLTPFTFDQLKQLAAKSLKSGWVVPVGGKNQIHGDTLEILDAGAVRSHGFRHARSVRPRFLR